MDNEHGITSVTMEDDLLCWCPMGEQMYSSHICIEAEVAGTVPDYLDVTRDIDALNHEGLTIEALCGKVWEIASTAFQTNRIRVECSVPRGKHLAVTVEKAMA